MTLRTWWFFTKKCTASSFLFNDATIALDNPLRFRENYSERISKLIMTIDDNIRDGRPWYDINREASQISVLSSGKTDKYGYLTGEKYYLLIKEEW